MTVAEDEPPTPRPRRGYLVPGLIALAVLAVGGLIFGLAALRSYSPRALDGPVVAQDLATDIQTSAARAESEPPRIACPRSEPARVGRVFDCTLERPGRPAQRIRVTVTATDGSFRYEVLPPP